MLVPEWNQQDLGISGYSGSNVKTLRGIIDSAKNGSIPQGAICIIEALDRATRLPYDSGYQILREMLLAGVQIYIAQSDRLLTRESLNDVMQVMITAVDLDQGHQFSRKLSDRVGKAWRKKREALAKGERLTKKVPGWIDADTWTRDANAKTVRLIFRMYVEGNGIRTIVEYLNSHGYKTFSKEGEFYNGYISLLLRNKAVIGEFQPRKLVRVEGKRNCERVEDGDPIKDYFPRVISDDLFYTVQAKLDAAQKFTARKTDSCANLFSGVAFCSCGCGSKMYLANGNKHKQYFTTWAKVQKNPERKCIQPSLRYDSIEDSFRTVFRLFGDQLLKSPGVDDTTASLQGRLNDLEKQADNITQALTVKFTRRLVEKQAELEDQIEELKAELEKSSHRVVSAQSDAERYRALVKELGKDEAMMAVRRRFRDWVLCNVSRMEFDGSKRQYTITFNNGQRHSVRFDEEWVFTIDGKRPLYQWQNYGTDKPVVTLR